MIQVTALNAMKARMLMAFSFGISFGGKYFVVEVMGLNPIKARIL